VGLVSHPVTWIAGAAVGVLALLVGFVGPVRRALTPGGRLLREALAAVFRLVLWPLRGLGRGLLWAYRTVWVRCVLFPLWIFTALGWMFRAVGFTQTLTQITARYREPTITMTPAVRISLVVLRFYLLALVGLVVLKFVQILTGSASAGL